MSAPFGQQQIPPVPSDQPAPFAGHHGKGSVGPVIAVLAVIAVLWAIAVLVGRLFSGKRVPGLGQYDVEGWLEEKFASCIDGRLESRQPRAPDDGGGAPVPEAAPPEMTPEYAAKQATPPPGEGASEEISGP